MEKGSIFDPEATMTGSLMGFVSDSNCLQVGKDTKTHQQHEPTKPNKRIETTNDIKILNASDTNKSSQASSKQSWEAWHGIDE